MNKQRIRKIVSIMLSISLLLGLNGNVKWAYATSYGEENEKTSIADTNDSEPVTEEISSEIKATEKASDSNLEDEKVTSAETEPVEEVSEMTEENVTVNATEESETVEDSGLSEDEDVESEELITALDTAGNDETVSLPTNGEPIDPNCIYEISNFDQWIALQSYSKEQDLYGFKFCYNSNGNSDTYDFTTQGGFEGLGSERFPFAGELYSNFATGNITLIMNKPLFSHLSSKATIRNIQIQAKGTIAGLAEYLVADISDMEVEYSDITIDNADNNSANGNVFSNNIKDNECVGGLFAQVYNDTNGILKITGSNVVVKAFVVGPTAGGLIGELKGNTELCLDGIKLPTYVSGVTNTTGIVGAVGAVVGSIEGADNNKITVKLSSDKVITYTYAANGYNQYAKTEYCGGLFGYIKNADIDMNASIKYAYTNSSNVIIGKNAGSFAGYIENSIITMYKPFECYNVFIKMLSGNNEDDWKQSGGGMFAGVLKNSTINIDNSFEEEKAAICIGGNEQIATKNINSPGKEKLYNCGGLIGYAYNSDLNFTQTHPCVINRFTTSYTNGNVAGIVGCYEVAENHSNGTISSVTVNNTRLVSYDGTTGGLVGYVKMNGGNVTISDCTYNGELRFAIQNADAVMSTGVAKVEAVGTTADKLTMENIQCDSTLYSELGLFTLEAYGAAIGIADADFEITGTENVFDHGDNVLSIGTDNSNIIQYYGGLVGEIRNKNSDTTTRKVSVNNVYVGQSRFPLVQKAFGGLFGKVEENSAVSLDGIINAAGENTGSGVSVSAQLAYFKSGYTTYIGSIAGEVNNALLYMEPDAVFTKSTKYECDEIGNYGGVIRNRYWDAQSDTETGELLIQDYQVTGTLSNILATTGDLIRFAIAMNTEGVFMPIGNLAENAAIENIDSVRTASYTLSQAKYDLTNSGLMCLGRNDKKGITTYPFKGSFTGIDDKSIIKYAITSYNQENIGLFPFIKAGDKGSTFRNLKLQYELQYKTQKSINAAYSSNSEYEIPRYPESEHMGGLAAFAKGNITVDNVSYKGTIMDTTEDANKGQDNDGNYIDNTDDYMGGFFGSYIGESDKTLTIKNLTTNMTFGYSDFTHALGGVIGYVDLGAVEDGTCDIQVENVNLGGDIKFYVDVEKPLKESSFITLIGDQNKTGADYVSKCNIAISELQVNNVNQKRGIDATKGYGEMGGFLGYNWMDVNVNLSDIKIGTDDVATLGAKAGFGGLVHTVSGKMVIDGLTIGNQTSFDISDWNTATVDQCGLLIRNGQYLYLDVRNYKVASGVTLKTYKGSYFDELVGFTKGGDDQQHGGIVSICSDDTYYLGRNDSTYLSFQNGHVMDKEQNIINKKNPNTRYYYDLNKLQLPSDTDYATLDSADDVMIWHLLHYANESIRKCIDPNYTSLPKSYTVKGAIDMTAYSIYPTPVSGESYTAPDGGTIKFNAQQIINGEKNLTERGNQIKYPEDKNFQHYQMHAGLFGDVSGITVKGLKIEGTYSKSANAAGALVAGSIYGIEDEEETKNSGKVKYDTDIKNKFSNITLDNLWCVSKDPISYDAPIGLMISNITSGANVTFDGISMTSYTDDDVIAGKKAASALIGNVGDSTATYINLTFKNMDIADAADGQSKEELHSSKKDEVLAKASFIYSYDYEENCNAFYLFTYDDYVNGRIMSTATKKVTLGRELDSNGGNPNYAKEEYFDEDMYVGKLTDTSQEIAFDCDNYLPYVSVQKRQILVNPKAGSITEGCGTYEDPYIIESTKQLITLYRYFYDEENFKDIFEMNGWQLNALGDDSELCDKSSNTSTGHSEPITYVYDNSTFPEAKKLSKAYYQIVGDIDLSEYPEFTGFGRSDMPFDGVFVGKKTTGTGCCPTVIMSEIGSTTTLSDYGFIQYAKGCVVKDLCIQFNEPVMINKTIKSSETDSGTIDEGGTGGGVIATVLGGENIIDHVAVKGKSTTQTDDEGNETTTYVQCFTPKNVKAVIGGYVGAVNLGGVILRNMDETCLQGFSVSLPTTSTSLDSYLYTCGIIGRVYDGYVVYDGADNSTASTPLFKNLTSLYSNDFWKVGSVDSPTEILNSQSRSYDIINGAYLEDKKDGNIGWSQDDNTGYTKEYVIANAVQLQVISMALNAGMLNYDANTKKIGYDYHSRQRSGDYSYVGNVGNDEESKSARNYVIKYDNMNKAEGMAYGGYLSKYFNWNENSIIKLNPEYKYAESFDGGWKCGKAILNPEDSVITYSLSGTEYDMSVYGSAFRGLGGRYGDNVSTKFQIYSSAKNVFHGNLIGTSNAPAKIKLGMYVDGIQDIDRVALLNNIIVDKTKEVQNIKIKNITLSGEVENKTDVGESFTYDDRNYDAGGFISFLKNAKVVFEDVTIDQLKVKSQNYAGAMVAWNDKSSELTEDVSVTFNNCGITSSADSHTTHDNEIIGMSVTGGFVGRAEIGATVKGISSLEHLYVGSGDVVDPNGVKEEGESAGGLIGRAEGSLNINGVAGEITENTRIPVGNDIMVQSAGKHVQIGGLVGCANIASNTYSFANITLENLTVENIYAGSYSNISLEGTDGIDIIGAGGIIGSAAATISMSNITVGSSDSSSKVAIRNTSDTIPNHSCYGNGGLVGRLMAGCILNLNKCSVLGVKNADGYTTVISGRGNSGGIAGNSNIVGGTNVTVQGVSIESARYAGGFSGWHESNQSCTLEEMQVKDVRIAFVGAHKDQGNIGGIIGNSAGYISLKNAKVSGLIIDSDYCKNAGGFVGSVPRSGSGYLKVEGDNNEVSNSLICGVKAGGVVGLMGCYSNAVIMCSNITIENNKIIASEEKTYDSSVYQYAAAGGFAGELGTNKSETTVDYMMAENLEIKGNLIACYGMNNQPAILGGVIGKNYSESYFYDVELADNYIGMVNQDELVSGAKPEDDAIKLRKEFLANTPIISTDSEDVLNQYLYYVTDTDKDGTYEIYTKKIASTTVNSEEYYQYCYLQGTFVGNVAADYGLAKFINVHVDYTDPSYCPVSDVGLSNTNSLGSNSDMYAAYRKLCAIVYDGEITNDATQSITNVFSGMNLTLDINMSNKDVPYIFGNLESIWNNYQDKKIPTSYRLEENYQGSKAIDKDSTVENYSNLTMEKIYQNTYKDEDEYKSPFKIGDNTIPMVVYNSAESGSLDQVIQTYINMLTNNSGALNSYVNSSKRNINVLGVDTYKMEIKNGNISVSTTGQSVTATKSAGKYTFTAVDGDELSQDGSNGSFTLIRIAYGWQLSGGIWTTKWRLDIPVYVEKRLKIYSNMKMVEGIQYDTDTIKTNGRHVLSDAANKESMTLARGNSYSIYAEYIYADALDKFTSLTIPKLFYTVGNNNANIPFSEGTKITLLPLDEQSKPYYYTVENSNQIQIDFSDFKDANGDEYELKNIKRSDANNLDKYTDLCNKEYENVVIERYVLLVDTSGVTEDRDNALYEMHISPKELWTSGNDHYEINLSSRTDYNEHCYEYVKEIKGVSYKINIDKDEGKSYANTYLDETSKISKGSSVKAHLQYDIDANTTYWETLDSNSENKTYVDIGFYLAIQDEDSYKKVPLPENTTILFGNGENTISVAAGKGQTTTYYYQSRNSELDEDNKNYMCINALTGDTSEQIDITFDFSNADMSDYEQYNGSSFSVVAELVVTNDKELPAAGEVKDSYSMAVDAEAESDIGFALEVYDLMTLGMNQYTPADSDSGVVPYTASIAFPTENVSKVAGKFYTIVYQIEEKVSQKDTESGKPEYKTYTGDDVSLYLGTFDNKAAAKQAAEGSTNSVNSGNGVTAVTYKFSTSNVTDGADLKDGQTPATDSGERTSGVIKTHCTLVANCSNLNMTNYRVRAYLIVSDAVPNDISGNYMSNASTTDTSGNCLNGYILRSENWKALSENVISEDTKNDFFVFTVAKIKTSMQ